MQGKKVLVLFVEPMLYGMDLIHEVYERTEYEFKYVYCTSKLTGKDDIKLPLNSYLLQGGKKEKTYQINNIFDEFKPDFAIINGYFGDEQKEAIFYCQKHGIKYAIESDTPLHIPENIFKAIGKKMYLKKLLSNDLCYGFPGGSIQKENLKYYGIPEERNFIMPMSVSRERLLNEYDRLPSKEGLKKELGIEGKRIFIFVGRLAEVKNVSILIEAFKEIRKKYEDTALLVVGDGPLKDELMKQASDTYDVQFPGYIVFPELIKYYKAADIFVLPSNYEPWGLVVNEAMTLGLPVIVSDVVGCREDIVRDNENGYVFKNNDVTDLIDKMEDVLNNDIVKMGSMAKEMMNNWNYEYYLECFKKAIEEC